MAHKERRRPRHHLRSRDLPISNLVNVYVRAFTLLRIWQYELHAEKLWYEDTFLMKKRMHGGARECMRLTGCNAATSIVQRSNAFSLHFRHVDTRVRLVTVVLYRYTLSNARGILVEYNVLSVLDELF